MRASRGAMGLAVTALLAANVVWAGQRGGWEVGIEAVERNAYGTIGTVRNSVDSVQYIGCSIRTFDTGPTQYVTCYAKDALGAYASCSTSAQNFVTVAETITTDSHIYFSWNDLGQCTYLFVDNGSINAPKTP
jgi:hypothetical protein